MREAEGGEGDEQFVADEEISELYSHQSGCDDSELECARQSHAGRTRSAEGSRNF